MNLAEVFTAIEGPDAPVDFVAYDGSKAGTVGSDIRVELRSPKAVELILSHPGQVGLARAYVAGELEIRGDIVQMLELLWSRTKNHRMSWNSRVQLVKQFGPDTLRAITGHRGEAPPEEKKLRGRRHSKGRDAEAIAHHYDVSNAFYRRVLGPSMAYTCAVFPTPTSTLEQAQEEKFDLVCRKLGLKPGMKLLDVGCGWGGMVLHAARNYGVDVIGVTLSEQQADWGQRAVIDAGLHRQAQVRFQDYRDVEEGGFDAISSIGLTEHIGKSNYPAYFRYLYQKARPGARLLNHSITRFNDSGKVFHRNSFINRYIFPDGEMTGPATIMKAMTGQDWEVVHEENLRLHYAKTLHAWRANLENSWDDAVRDVGERKARVWRLYMAVSEFGFQRNVIQLHQFLGVKTTAEGKSTMPLRPDFSPAHALPGLNRYSSDSLLR